MDPRPEHLQVGPATAPPPIAAAPPPPSETPNEAANDFVGPPKPRRASTMLTTWHAVNGLVTIPDILNKVGFWLYKGTLRRTMSVGFGLLAILLAGKSTDAITLTVEQALTGVGMVLIISCLGGATLMALGGSFAKARMRLVEGRGSNMIEDMRKELAPEHRKALWEHVFRYEHEMQTPAALEAEEKLIRQHRLEFDWLCRPHAEHLLTPERRRHFADMMRRVGLTREGWRLVFDFMFHVPMSRSGLRDRLRWDLSKVKDWYDGSPFHPNDTRLQEQFNAVEELQAARKQVGLGPIQMLRFMHRRTLQRIWFGLITRAIQMHVAEVCRYLDDLYPQYHFAPDVVLWPSETTHDIVRSRCGQEAVDTLTQLRRRVFHRVLSPREDLAYQLLQQAIYPNYAIAAHLRRLYDPQYVTGELRQNWLGDLHLYRRAFQPSERKLRQYRRFVDRTRREQAKLHELLDSLAPQPDLACPEARRAVGIAMHLNWRKLRRHVMRSHKPTRAAWAKKVAIEAARQRKTFTRKLIAVRVHHELTRLELSDYELYLRRILA